MAQIDTLLQKLSEMNADCADLRADEQVEVVAAGAVKKGAHLPADLLQSFLLEIIPSEKQRELKRQLPFEFVYPSPHGYYEVAISWSADRLQAVIEPTDALPDERPLEVALASGDNVAMSSEAVSSDSSLKFLSILLVVSVVVALGIGAMVYLQP